MNWQLVLNYSVRSLLAHRVHAWTHSADVLQVADRLLVVDRVL